MGPPVSKFGKLKRAVFLLGYAQREHSMLSFEGAQLQGATAIVEKLVVSWQTPSPSGWLLEGGADPTPTGQSLPFTTVKHEVATMDPQPSPVPGALIVLVTGKLVVRPRFGL